MRRSIKIIATLAVALWVGFSVHQVWAYPSMAMKTKAACASCHTNVAGGADLTDAGKAYMADPEKAPEAGKSLEYVGSKKCMMCHMKVHKAWQTTAHAKAFENLVKADAKAVEEMAAKLEVELTGTADKTDACVSCHVTGFKLAGGYPAADSAKTAVVAAVGCESCHGPGSEHVALVGKAATKAQGIAAINGKVGEKMCKDCHTATVSPKFDFATAKAKGVHTVAEAAK